MTRRSPFVRPRTQPPTVPAPFLVIDDNGPAGNAVARALRALGPALAMRSVAEARQWLEAGHHPRAILCDRDMPGESGEAFHAWLVRERPDLATRFALVTARPGGVCGIPVLCKPVTVAGLRGLVRDLVTDREPG